MKTTHVNECKPMHNATALHDESNFWLKAVKSWKKVIQRIVQEAGEINASPAVTAEVARLAGELSLLDERLDPLLYEIEQHVQRTSFDDKALLEEYQASHQVLCLRLMSESNLLRNLMSEMFQLEHSAYKRFLS